MYVQKRVSPSAVLTVQIADRDSSVQSAKFIDKYRD